MSKSPYLSNPNILAHPDRIVQKVELDMTAQDSYLAGSPISAEGKLANDANAIGILLYDVHKAIGGRTGVVVIFGRIKQDVAAEHSGITISAEAKAALIDITFTGDGCRMGGGGLTELPEGYPYKEQSEIVIEWDGNTEGLANFGNYYKVSDAVYDDLFGAKVIADNCDSAGNYIYTLANKTNMQGLDGYLVSEKDIVYAAFASMPAVVVVPQGNDMGAEPGTYFFNDESFYIAKMTYGNETIHTMAPEFLPAGVGGGGLVFEITESDYTNEASTYTVAKSYDPIYEQLDKGGSVVIKLHDATGIVFIVPQMSMVLAGQGFAIISRGMQSNMTLRFTTGSYH